MIYRTDFLTQLLAVVFSLVCARSLVRHYCCSLSPSHRSMYRSSRTLRRTTWACAKATASPPATVKVLLAPKKMPGPMETVHCRIQSEDQIANMRRPQRPSLLHVMLQAPPVVHASTKRRSCATSELAISPFLDVTAAVNSAKTTATT